MKTIVFIISLFISIGLHSQQRRNNLNDNNRVSEKLVLTSGGIMLSIAGFITPDIYTDVNTVGYNIQRNKLPLHQQGPKFGCIIGGVTVTIGGLVSLMFKR